VNGSHYKHLILSIDLGILFEMIINKKIGCFVVFLLAVFIVDAQEEHPDCTNPKKIVLPLTEEIDKLTQNEIYYEPEDKYTYWYKMEVIDDYQFSYQLEAINKNDEYELLIYKYDGGNFCNDLVNKKKKAISNDQGGTMNVKKGDVYYFGILHLAGYGCGHQFTLTDENKNATIKAIQNECVEEVMEPLVIEEIIEEVTPDTIIKKKEKVVIKETPKQQDEILEEKKKNLCLKGWVVNSNTLENIDANLVVIPVSGGVLQQVQSTNKDGFELPNFKEQRIVVSIEKFGYETLQDTLTINSDTIRITLNPIKIGEKLVMHKIYFHPNTYVLKQESKQELAKLHQFMKENSNYSFEIQGHTNGNRNIKKMQQYAHLGEEWNFKGTAKKLSKYRAEKIKKYLVKNGIDEARLRTIGYGGDRMIIDKPKNMKQAMQNIRVEVIVIQ